MPAAETAEVASITRVINKSTGDYQLCSSFTLTKENAITYFSIADEVDANRFDQDAIILPCKYQGTIKKASHLYQWEIFAGGAGYLYDDQTNKRFLCQGKCLDALPNVRGP